MKKSKHRCKHGFSWSARPVDIHIISANWSMRSMPLTGPQRKCLVVDMIFISRTKGRLKEPTRSSKCVLMSSASCVHEEKCGLRGNILREPKTEDDRGCPQIKIPTRRQLTLVSSSVGESKCGKSRYLRGDQCGLQLARKMEEENG